jgi:glyoxylase-like metal-dependent hydrolase (beta-lactamase superfamily II)
MSRPSDAMRLGSAPVDVQEIARGLWRWTAPHPEWTPGADWPEEVGCVYYEGADAVVLIDPLVPTDEADRFWDALDRDVERAGQRVVVLRTVHWHHRSTDEVIARHPGALMWTGGSNEPLPTGIEAYPVERADETLFWIAEHRALLCGDVLLGTEGGGVRVCPDSWLAEEFRGPAFKASLRFLLELPIELVLVSHGQPVLANGREALAAALA